MLCILSGRGTAAALLPDQIDEEEKARRADIVMQEQMLISDEKTGEMLGEVCEVVVEGFDRYAECWFGRSSKDVPEIDGKVFFTSKRQLSVGEYVFVRITDVMDYDPLGEVVEES